MTLSLRSKFRSVTRRALFVSSDKLAVYHWAKDTLGGSYLFDATSDGFKFFGRYLNKTPNVPVYVLLDTSAEEFRLDTIPHVSGADRKALIDRKQDRLFRGTLYHYTAVQGREESGRRDDNIMLSAITNPDVIQPWLTMLDGHKVPVAGVISVPLLLQEIDNIIPDMRGNVIVFSLQSISGLRQSFYRDKFLKFSRLAKLPRYGAEPYASIITEELIKVRHYLNGAGLVDESKPLDIHFFGNAELLGELGKTHINSSVDRFHMHDVNVLAETDGFIGRAMSPFSDKYFISYLLRYKSKNYYAVSKETRYFQMWWINKSLKMASLLLVLSSIVWGGLDVLQGLTYRQQQAADAQKADYYKIRYEVARERISVLPVEPADLKVIVDTRDVLKTYKADPVAMFELISKGLDIFPQIEISDMQWVANTNPNHKPGEGNVGSVIEQGSQSVSGLGHISETETVYIYYQIALLKGQLKNFDGNYRKVLKTIDDFSHSLRQGDAVHDVSVVTLPLDISSDASLQGTTKEVGNSNSDFAIRIVLGIRNDA